MAATTTLLGLLTPTQGTLSGTWGDSVNYGISDYVDISVAGTLTLTNDGAVTLANTTGSSSGNSITSSLTGAGTVTAQFAIVKVTGTLTVAKVVTGPSYSKTYTVVNSATGGIVTFKASGQTGVSIAVGESAFVYFNGTDYVKVVGTATAGAAGGSTTQVQFNSSGILSGSSSLTWNGTSLSATQIDITAQGTLRLQDTTGGEYVALRAPATLGANYTLTFPADDGTSGQALITDGSGVLSWSTAASGDVYGPASSTDNAVARFDSTTGKLLQNSVVLIGDTGAVTGVTDLTTTGNTILGDASTDTLNVGNGGLVKDASGNVGIGTTSPASILHVKRTTGSSTITIDYNGTNIGRAEANANGNLYFGLTTGSGSVSIGTTSVVDAIYVASAGNVGIGTTSPTVKLEVSSAVTNGYTPIVRITRPSASLNDQFLAFYNGVSTDAQIGRLKNSDNLLFGFNSGVSFATSMTLDTSGNLGLGVTPSAWGAGLKVIQIGTQRQQVLLSDGAGTSYFGTNWYYDTAFKYKDTGFAMSYNQLNTGNHVWQIAPSGTAGNAITFTQAMTLDASGNLGIGTSSPSFKLDVVGITRVVGGSASSATFNANQYIRIDTNANGGYTIGAPSSGAITTGYYFTSGTVSYAGGIEYQNTTNALSLRTNNTTKATIDSAGNVLVGGTAARGTTAGTAHLDLFNGTAPAGTLTDGVSLYSSSGDLKFMNAAGDAFDVGYRNIPQNSQSAAYTLVLADAGKHIFHPSTDANARTFTIPANSSVAYPIGTAITFINMTSQVVTIAITTDTMYLSSAGTTGSRSLAQYGSATAIKMTSTTWLISGSGLT
jgi:hypothetical protein